MAIENPSQAVVADDYEAFAELSNQREVSERLGTKPEPKAVEPKPEEKTEEATPKPKAPGSLSFKQLRERVRTLEAENKQLREAPVASKEEETEEKPAKARPEELRARPRPDDKNEKGEAKYKTWQEYEDDFLAWSEEKISRGLEERNAKRTQEAEISQINNLIETSWRERCEKAREAHEDFDEALDPENGPGKLIQPGSLVDEWILDSELGAEMLYYFHQHHDELLKFQKIDGPTPGAKRAKVRRMLVNIEEKISGEVHTDEKPKMAREAEARVTKTPKPSSEVGGRASMPTDRKRAAVANDDVAAYMDEADRQDIAQRLGSRR